MTRLERDDWAHLLPHGGAMCLLDVVEAWDADSIRAASHRHGDAGHPLRVPAGLHAVHLVEYGAQAMALHGALLARGGGDTRVRAGVLVSLRDACLAVERVDADGGPLEVRAQRLHADTSGALYTFQVLQAGHQLARGRVAALYDREAGATDRESPSG
jgi:predicted hotdog family 3-hydroxylacyl-ACP dehydratase